VEEILITKEDIVHPAQIIANDIRRMAAMGRGVEIPPNTYEGIMFA